MQRIAIDPPDILATGEVVGSYRIPPRMCGAPNLAAAERIAQWLTDFNPSAFDPVPEAVAVAVQRDVPLEAKPPNCDGNRPIPRASFPPYVTDDREDDEGEAIHGYPPGVACSITGECE